MGIPGFESLWRYAHGMEVGRGVARHRDGLRAVRESELARFQRGYRSKWVRNAIAECPRVDVELCEPPERARCSDYSGERRVGPKGGRQPPIFWLSRGKGVEPVLLPRTSAHTCTAFEHVGGRETPVRSCAHKPHSTVAVTESGAAKQTGATSGRQLHEPAHVYSTCVESVQNILKRIAF